MKNHSLLLFGIFAILLVPSSVTAEFYSVEARDAPMADMIRLLAFIDKKNVVIPGDLTGTIIASFPQIGIRNALDSILESGQLVSELAPGNVLQISTQKTQEALGKDLSTVSFNLDYAKSNELGAQARRLVAGTKSTVLIDERTNSITMRGTEDQIKSIRTLIDSTDKIDKQVLIEAKIVDASKSFTRSLGIQWGVNGSFGPLNIGGFNATGSAQSGRPLNLGAPSKDSISGISAALGPLGSTFLDTQISAGEENGNLAVLSRPSIVTMNNQAATIRSGLVFYIRTAGNVTIGSGGTSAGTGTGTGSGASTGAPTDPSGGTATTPTSGTNAASGSNNNLVQVTSGITLVVTPHVTPNNKISLSINVVFSKPDFSHLVGDIPSINDNSATTSVLLEDGATTVIGGLAEHSNSKSSRGLPWLSKIPFFGPLLFGNSSKEKSDRELLIFITPTVVKEIIKEMRGFQTKNLNQDDGK